MKTEKRKENKKFRHLGIFLETARVRAGLTQKQLSEKVSAPKLSVHSQFVSNWERGICAPPEHCFKKLRKVLNLEKCQNLLKSEIEKDAIFSANLHYKNLLK